MSTDVPILRNSERTAFKRCPRKWWWAYREGLKPRGAERTPLWFGTGVHLAFAEWYLPGMTKRGINRGPHPAETFERYAGDALRSVKVVSETDEEMLVQWEDAKSLGIVLMEEYVKHYGRDEHMKFIQAEKTFGLLIPWPKDSEERQAIWEIGEDGEPLVDLRGTYDGVYRDERDGKLKLLETKTAKAVVTTHLALDDQAGTYWAVAARTLRAEGLIGPKERLHGITYNFVRKALPDDRPKDAEGYFTNKPKKEDYVKALEGFASQTPEQLSKLKLSQLEIEAQVHGLTVLGERSKVQPLPLFHREDVWRTAAEQRSQLLRIQDEALHMRAVRDRLLPIVKTPARDCPYMCDYFSMCELQERGGDVDSFRQANYRVEDPYADHRKSAESVD